jgi:hypothetical protein
MTKTDSTFIGELGLRRVGTDPKSKTKTFLSKNFEEDLLGSVRRLEKAKDFIRDMHNEHILEEKTKKDKWNFEDPDSRYKLLRQIQTSYNVDREIASILLDDVKRVKSYILEDSDSLPQAEKEKLDGIVQTCDQITGDPIRKKIALEIVSLQNSIFVTRDLEILVPKASKLNKSTEGYKLELKKLKTNPEYKDLPDNYLLVIAKIITITKNNKDEINSKFITAEIWNENFRMNPTVCNLLRQIKNS